MKQALIIGYGESGKGAAKFLMSKGWKVRIYSDKEFDKNLRQFDQNLEFVSNICPKLALQGIDLVVISPSIELNHPIVEQAKRQNINVIGEIELGYENCNSKIIAITGTNGKTTTTKLIGEIINLSGTQAHTLGNIGQSFCGSLDNIKSDDIVVLELSSFQLESIKDFCPRVAVCLNVTPDHFERHKNIENYALAKFRIFINQSAQDFAILNYDDNIVRDFCDSINSQIFFVSNKSQVKGCFVFDNNIYINIDEEYKFMSLEDVPIKGEHNYQNVMTAILACKLIGIEDKYIIEGISKFKLPRYRNEYVGNIDGIDYFNDSKATNIDSTLKACKSMKGDTSLIVGGYDKGISYDEFFEKLPSQIKHIIATGDNVYSIMASLPNYHEYTFEITASLERAIELARQKQVKNILFSPTTSSFDRYKSYEERGEHFDMIVKNLGN